MLTEQFSKTKSGVRGRLECSFTFVSPCVWVLAFVLLQSVFVALALAAPNEQLIEASRKGNLELVKQLLDKGADPNAEHKN